MFSPQTKDLDVDVFICRHESRRGTPRGEVEKKMGGERNESVKREN